MSWQDRAKCKGLTDLFFPFRGDDAGAARLICWECPVQTECLNYALEHSIVFGVWGGKSERQRRRMRVERRVELPAIQHAREMLLSAPSALEKRIGK